MAGEGTVVWIRDPDPNRPNVPPGMGPPNVIQYNASNVPVAQLTVSSESIPEERLFDYGLNFIRVRLFTIPGLSTPAPFGGKTREIVIDINPAKQGSYLPGTRLKIEPLAVLMTIRPDTVVVTNPGDRDAIAMDLAAMGLTPEISTL